MKHAYAILIMVVLTSFYCYASDSDDALFLSVKNNDLSGVEKALKNNADINARDKNNETAIVLAVRNRNPEIARLLIDRGTDLTVKTKDGYSILLLAISTEYLDMVRLVIEKGIDINAKENVTENKGDTALVFAAGYGREPRNNKIVDFLIEKGANVNAKNKNGYTALMHKSFQQNLETVKLLLAKGAEINAKNKYGGTALTCALSERVSFEDEIYPLIALLVKHGADVNVKDDGRTPLMSAAEKSYADSIRLFLDKGAKINEYNDTHETALLVACKNGNLSSVKTLLDSGASPNIADNEGITPLMHALVYYYRNDDRKKIVQLLLSFKADIEAVDKNGKSVVHWAEEGNVPLTTIANPTP